MTDAKRELSQVACFGGPQPKTWDDYEAGCHGTYGGGYRTEKERAIFRHGMSTVFNLLRKEFPTAEQCKAAALFAPVGWQTIATAPKDGTRIVIAEFDGERWQFCADWWRTYSDGIGSGFGSIMIPTHWMPLPEAPTEAAARAFAGEVAAREVNR